MAIMFAVMLGNYTPVFNYYSLQEPLLKCPLMVSICPLSDLEKCLSYKVLQYSEMTETRHGVRLIEVSIKTELTVSVLTSRM